MLLKSILEKLYNSKLLSLLLGSTFCALGCALAIFYSEFNFDVFIECIAVILTGIGLQSLFKCALDYSQAYKLHKNYRLKGIITPLMIGNIAANKFRKMMAIITLFTAATGAMSLYIAVGSNIQILSWFIFLVTISILVSLFYSFASAKFFSWLGRAVLFIFFGLVSIHVSQSLVMLSAKASIDVYPDTWSIGMCVCAQCLMIIHVLSMRGVHIVQKDGKTSLIVLFGQPVSFIYLLILALIFVLTSIGACVYSHRAWELVFIAPYFILLAILIYKIIKNSEELETIKYLNKQLTLCFVCHNIFWIILLSIDSLIYNA